MSVKTSAFWCPVVSYSPTVSADTWVPPTPTHSKPPPPPPRPSQLPIFILRKMNTLNRLRGKRGLIQGGHGQGSHPAPGRGEGADVPRLESGKNHRKTIFSKSGKSQNFV